MKRVNRDFKSIKSVVLLPSAGIRAIRNNSMKDVYNAFRHGMGKRLPALHRLLANKEFPFKLYQQKSKTIK